MKIRHLCVLLPMFTAVLLTGCGGTAGGPDAGAATSAPAAASAEPAEPSGAPVPPSTGPGGTEPTGTEPTGSEPTGSAVPPAPGAGSRTLTGTVVAGVEPGCLLLQGAGFSHLLVFGPGVQRSAAVEGARLTVVGEVKPDLMTTCQQGAPIVVSEIRPG